MEGEVAVGVGLGVGTGDGVGVGAAVGVADAVGAGDGVGVDGDGEMIGWTETHAPLSRSEPAKARLASVLRNTGLPPVARALR